MAGPRAGNGRHVAIAVIALAAAVAPRAPAAERKPPAPPDAVDRGCPPERAQNGEVRIAFLGDSGYGEGFSEWGTQGQDAVARQLAGLKLEPDLVFFLGDNIYWRGSSELYKARFDDVYDPLIRGCKAHVALGNHDVKGCRAVVEYKSWQSCLQDLRAAAEADRKARYLRQGLKEDEAAAKAKADVGAESAGKLTDEALKTERSNCLPGDATAYEEAVAGKSQCNATKALAHTQFGFGSIEKGEPPSPLRQRYYSILWPLPKVTPAGKAAEAPGPPPRPLVDVIVLDSNTLDVDDGVLGHQAGRREDQLQLLWLRNAMEQWLPAPGEKHRIWKIVAMHHPPYTPRGCVCRMFGKCFGGHTDQTGLRDQLNKALQDLEPPDILFTAHNHIYARSLPLDREGRPVTSGTGGVRYFVTGGGGGPLYAIKEKDPRFVKAANVFHFVYLRLTAESAFFWTIDAGGKVRDSGCFDKGSNVDHPLAASFGYADSLPPRCGAAGGGT
jgi:hypothetical protein